MADQAERKIKAKPDEDQVKQDSPVESSSAELSPEKSKRPAEPPWFQDGLRFGCRQCGSCCTGEPGYVWVTDEEIERLAAAVGLSRSLFESRFVRLIGGQKKSLIEFANGDCVLYDPIKRGCRVYDVRPVQCRTWPFWNQNIDLRNSWKKTARFCKGCNNPNGRLYSAEEIIRQRDQEF